MSRRKIITHTLSTGGLGALAGYVILHPLYLSIMRTTGEILFEGNAFCYAFSFESLGSTYFFMVFSFALGCLIGLFAYRYRLMVRLATMDRLTGLYNRRYYDIRIAEETERAIRYRRPLSLLVMDIDNFKNYNDQNGHDQGDYLLQELSALLRKNVRRSDIVCRYGGEEFVVIAPESNREKAKSFATKIRRAIQNYPFKYRTKQPKGRVTVSVGVADVPNNAEDPEALFKLADEALYKAKRAGRNKVFVAESFAEKRKKELPSGLKEDSKAQMEAKKNKKK